MISSRRPPRTDYTWKLKVSWMICLQLVYSLIGSHTTISYTYDFFFGYCQKCVNAKLEYVNRQNGAWRQTRCGSSLNKCESSTFLQTHKLSRSYWKNLSSVKTSRWPYSISAK